MRKILLKLGILCTLILAVIYAFGAYLTPLWQKFGDPIHAQNKARLFLLIGALVFFGLHFIRKMTFLLVLLLLALLLFLLYYFDVFQWINIFG